MSEPELPPEPPKFTPNPPDYKDSLVLGSVDDMLSQGFAPDTLAECCSGVSQGVPHADDCCVPLFRQIEELQARVDRYEAAHDDFVRAVAALARIAAMPTKPRPDGTFNHCRAALIDIAREALNA